MAFGGCDDDDPAGGTGGTSGTGGTGARGGTGGTGGSTTGGTGGSTGGTGGSTTGGTGGSTGGTGGSTGGTGGSTGGTGGSSDAADAPVTDTGGDAGGETAASGWTNCAAQNPKLNVSANEFCMQYMTACGFGAVMGRTAEQSFAMMGDCVTRYNSYADPGTATTGKGCAAYHLCQASQTGNMMTHCPHPAQAGGPCNLPAR
jgi:hypothetical protein